MLFCILIGIACAIRVYIDQKVFFTVKLLCENKKF